MEFTSSLFYRVHGKGPRGRGSWGFQPSRSFTAFDDELITGPVYFAAPDSTYSEAKAQARRHYAEHGHAGAYIAVLP